MDVDFNVIETYAKFRYGVIGVRNNEIHSLGYENIKKFYELLAQAASRDDNEIRSGIDGGIVFAVLAPSIEAFRYRLERLNLPGPRKNVPYGHPNFWYVSRQEDVYEIPDRRKVVLLVTADAAPPLKPMNRFIIDAAMSRGIAVKYEART